MWPLWRLHETTGLTDLARPPFSRHSGPHGWKGEALGNRSASKGLCRPDSHSGRGGRFEPIITGKGGSPEALLRENLLSDCGSRNLLSGAGASDNLRKDEKRL